MRGSEGPVAVLAAEDNEINQMVLTGLLEQARPDYAVQLANDGAEALEAWREGAFALILMDVRMPGMDGREATQRIRAEEVAGGRARTPIVALTGEAMESEIAACYDAGMDAHVCKPFEIGTLLQAIDKANEANAVFG
jgi:CheY-like chemotaxis protein